MFKRLVLLHYFRLCNAPSNVCQLNCDMRMLTHPTAFLSRCSLRPLAAWPSLKTEGSLFSIPACINTYSLITATRRNHRKSYTWGTHSRALGPWLSGRPAHSLRTLTTWKDKFVFMLKMRGDYWETFQQTAVSCLSYRSTGEANWSFYSLGSWGALKIQENGHEKALTQGVVMSKIAAINIGKEIT